MIHAPTPMLRPGRPRRFLGVLLLALVAVALPACGERDQARDDLEDAIRRTRELSYRFVYTDSRPEGTIAVRGFTEDDFRVKARVDYDGEAGFEQVISDDTLAVRVFSPQVLDELVDPRLLEGPGLETELEGISPLEVLRTRRWVVDPEGAPLLGGGAARDGEIGLDPVRDALSGLDYVERAVREAIDVEEYSPDDLSPVYPSSEDTFPQPEDGSGVIRFDLRRPDLPVFQAGGAGGEQDRLETRHFRKMAVYVKDGVIIRVIERVEAIGSFFGEAIDFMRRLLDEIDAPEEASEGLEEFAQANIPEDERSDTLLQIINTGLVQFGLDPILAREMVLDLADHGSFSSVALPEDTGDTVIEGSLQALLISGASFEDDAPAEPDAEVDAPAEGAGDGEVVDPLAAEPDDVGPAGEVEGGEPPPAE